MNIENKINARNNNRFQKYIVSGVTLFLIFILISGYCYQILCIIKFLFSV